MDMAKFNNMLRGLKSIFGQRVATPQTDMDFFSALPVLPNPDPILRQIGQADRVYASIMTDAHVIGEVRSIRGEFRTIDYRIVTWDETNPQAQAARDLCEWWMQRITPNPTADWLEIMWQMTSAIFTGFKTHELVWDDWNGQIVPVQLIDVRNQRCVFSIDSELMIKSRSAPLGGAVEPYRFAISRHMASMENPYGIALLSSCFWPWTFKTGGWRYFVKFCERHGLPWPIARYPEGTTIDKQQELADALVNMIENAYAVVPEGTGVDLLEVKTANMLPQESLINLANREMSKALVGQAMVSELQKVGARSASEVAQDRQGTINDSDRDIPTATFSRIFRLITDFNFGPEVPSPELEFFKPEAQGKERAETYILAANAGARPSKKAMLEELNIPAAVDDADALMPAVVPSAPALFSSDPNDPNAAEIKADQLAAADEARQINEVSLSVDAALEASVLDPIARMLAQFEQDGKTLVEFRNELGSMIGNIDESALRNITAQAMQHSFMQGYSDKSPSRKKR